MSDLTIYAAPELGAYGWVEKPWYLPGARLGALLDELEARDLTRRLDFREAAPATDAELQLFHSAAHLESVRRRCAANDGSLDVVPEPVARDVERLLETVGARQRAGSEPLVSEVGAVVSTGMAPAMTLEAYVAWLAGLDLLRCDLEAPAPTLSLTEAGRRLLGGGPVRLGGPTFARVNVERAATAVVGAVVDATRRILAGEARVAFVPIAGYHHAHREEARLYCLYNDPAIALAWALARTEGHVAYVDIDIHHGDGVYEGFAEEPGVVIADLHEDPSTLFPFTPDAPGKGERWGRRDATGRGAGAGTKLNIPLAPNTTDAEYLAKWAEAEAFIRAARPRFIVFEAGVDGLGGDPMSNQLLSDDVVYQVTRRVRAVADECADGRLLVLGGGGYELQATARAWARVVEALLA